MGKNLNTKGIGLCGMLFFMSTILLTLIDVGIVWGEHINPESNIPTIKVLCIISIGLIGQVLAFCLLCNIIVSNSRDECKSNINEWYFSYPLFFLWIIFMLILAYHCIFCG
jgi:heme/copper-type cytochrome/quinol oxidase subunit 4